jgi:type I restriction enzyme R subunit
LLSESDTRAKLIDPKLREAGWEESQIVRDRFITDGRIIVKGTLSTREKRKKPDYILYFGSIPIAVVEAKDTSHSPLDGMQQAKEYAEMLQIKFAYSTNGHGIKEFDYLTNTQKSLERFPSPQELWERLQKTLFSQAKEVAEKRAPYITSKEKIEQNPLTYPYHTQPGGKEPRYYQEAAITKIIESILKGKKRILLTMATGTGKTYVAFQVVWKLLKSKYFKRVLYIADRNFLRDQAYNEFFPFEDGQAFIEEGKTPKNREVFFSIYQALYSEHDGLKLYQKYPPDFFDLVIIDECHRSGYGTWREILDYFSPAVQLGMTATPKRDDNIDTYAYFGEPVYFYSMGQGIQDGFLAPFHIHRVLTSIDKEGLHLKDAIFQGAQVYIPEEADIKDYYGLEEFEREVSLPDRTRKICEDIVSKLKTFGEKERTIIYCVSSEHAAEVAKELQNHFAHLGYPDYAVRIVAEEPNHEALYESFKDSEKVTPVVATTVDLLTTGVDIPSVRNIILLKPISSKVYFKQIIGRGSRLDEVTEKHFFRIIDYVNATRLLDNWDYPEGTKIKVVQPPFDLKIEGKVIHSETQLPLEGIKIIAQLGPNMRRETITDSKGEFILTELPHSSITLYLQKGGFRSRQITLTPTPDMEPLLIELKPEKLVRKKIVVKGIEVHIAEETRIVLTADGKSLSEAEYIEYSKEGIKKKTASFKELLEIWVDPDKRSKFLEALKEESIYPELLSALLKQPDADTFDILAHLAFGTPILSKDERAQAFINKRQQFIEALGPEPKEVVLALLDKYRVGGIEQIKPEIFEVPPFDHMGYAPGVSKRFGGPENLRKVMQWIQKEIYAGG